MGRAVDEFDYAVRKNTARIEGCAYNEEYRYDRQSDT
jgi:hypothetical protein